MVRTSEAGHSPRDRERAFSWLPIHSPPDSGKRRSLGQPATPALLSVPANVNGRLGVQTNTMLTITENCILYGRYEIDLATVEAAVTALRPTPRLPRCMCMCAATASLT